MDTYSKPEYVRTPTVYQKPEYQVRDSLYYKPEFQRHGARTQAGPRKKGSMIEKGKR